jgi:RNA polymerase sigma-70 factor (sigma-E family)
MAALPHHWGVERFPMTYEAFVRAYADSLVALGYVLTGDVHEAQDLAQEAFLRAYTHWERVSSAGNPPAYVKRILLNLHIGKSRGRVLVEIPSDLTARPGRVEVDEHQADELLEMLDRLPGRQRAAVVLRYYEDLTDVEIGEVLGISPSTVRSSISRALQRLRIEEVRATTAPTARKEDR